MMLVSTLRAETERLDGLAAALNRQRFAALARCDLDGARRVHKRLKQIRRQKEALVTGELFDLDDET